MNPNNNNQEILKSIVRVMDEEAKIASERMELIEKFEQAENLGLVDEMEKISKQSDEVEKKMRFTMGEKIIAFSNYFFISKSQKDFMYN